MCGDRDSEIAVVVRDNEFVEGRMDGKFYLAAKFAHTLRMVREVSFFFNYDFFAIFLISSPTTMSCLHDLPLLIPLFSLFVYLNLKSR